MPSLVLRHAEAVDGVLSCFDRVLIHGTPEGIGFPGGMGRLLKDLKVRTEDFPRWAEQHSRAIRENAEQVAQEHGLAIEFLRRRVRKEDRIEEILRERGRHPGLVHVLAAMETCTTFRVRWDRQKKKAWLVKDTGKCVHYYFYFIDPELGLAFVRVATWAPFRIHVYFNAHGWLASQLEMHGIPYSLADNVFVSVRDWAKAQALADGFDVKRLHKALDWAVSWFCPVARVLGRAYRWSLEQVEYATDIVFKQRQTLADLYDPLIRHALHAIKAENVAQILGRRMPKTGELTSDIARRQGFMRLKHRMEWVSIKAYDKAGRVLRIETTTSDPLIFNHYRRVVQKDGQIRFKVAKVRKTIYSLDVMRQKLGAANQRYLEFLGALEMPLEGAQRLKKLAEPVRHNDRPYPGFNLFHGKDQKLFEVLGRGEFTIHGFRNRDLRKHLALNTAATSRCLKRFTLHGLLWKVPGSSKYLVTSEGRRAIVCALALKESLLAPAFSRLDHEQIFANLHRS